MPNIPVSKPDCWKMNRVSTEVNSRAVVITIENVFSLYLVNNFIDVIIRYTIIEKRTTPPKSLLFIFFVLILLCHVNKMGEELAPDGSECLSSPK